MNQPLQLIDVAAISPLLIILLGSLIILLYESFARKKSVIPFYFTSIVLLIAMLSTYFSPISQHPLLTPWLRFDALSKTFTFFFLIIGLTVTFLSYSFFDQFKVRNSEFFFLLLSSLFGLILIGSSADFLTLFIGIETLSISLYVLCAYVKNWSFSQEAGLKYFLMGSLAAAFLLYGVALVYGAIGTTQFDALLPSYQHLQENHHKILFLAGIALVTLGLAFEAAIVPFHIWAPDVYSGAATPVTAFMSVGTKVGAFAAFIRVFLNALPQFDSWWNEGMAFLAYPTLIFANFLAMVQNQLRRFFAYSSIAHAGFMLIPLAVGTENAISSLLFYLIVYSMATLGSFAVLSYIDTKEKGPTMQDVQGLFYKSPGLTLLFILCLLTLAGIPPLLGFFAKFYIFQLAFSAQLYGLVFVGLLTSILSAYYYLNITFLMFSKEPQEEKKYSILTWPVTCVGICSFIAIVYFSLFPQNLLKYTFY